MNIDSIEELDQSIESGPYVFPGGYPKFFICKDGGILSFGAVKDNLALIREAIQEGFDDQWIVVACDINWEDDNLYCDHSGELIPSAYGEEE